MIKEEEEAEDSDDDLNGPDHEVPSVSGQRKTKSTLKSDKSGASRDPSDHAQN